MGAIIHQFKNGIKHDMLFLDTSFLIDSICPKKGTPPSRISECKKFWTKLGNRIAAGRLLCYVSDLVLEEFFFQIAVSHYELELPNYPQEKSAYEAAHPGRTFDWYQLYHNRPELLKDCVPKLDEFYSKIILLGILLVQPVWLPSYVIPPLPVSAKEIMTDFHPLSADAFHIATAKALGLEGIVALDEHFHNVDGIVVYTCLPP